jgi:hypothetical protein
MAIKKKIEVEEFEQVLLEDEAKESPKVAKDYDDDLPENKQRWTR